MDALKRIVSGITSRISGLRAAPEACAALEPQVTPAAELAGDPTLTPGMFCMPVERVEPLLRDGDVQILGTAKCASGVAGAEIVYLHFPSEKLTVKAKWKEAKRGGTGLNNEPRKEVAAYLVQQWFLAPDEYVVPPTVCRAIPLAHYTQAVRETKPTFEGTGCAFGVLAAWIDHVDELPPLDLVRFESHTGYRDTMANMNLLTYLIDHRDTRPANFIFSKDPARPRALSIDNGLAFSGLVNPRILFKHEWRELLVPKLPREKIDRLRGLRRKDLDRLRTVAQLEVVGGQLVSVDRDDEMIEGDGPVRRAGDVLQLGLEEKEVDGIEARITHLLHEVDEGHVELY